MRLLEMCVRQTSRVSDPRTGNYEYQLEPDVIILDMNVLISVSPVFLTSFETIIIRGCLRCVSGLQSQ